MISKRSRSLAPGILTAMNLFLGFYAAILASGENYVTASWLIILAGVFDVFDGKVARATKTFSNFGEELDSLADVISFGLAPSLLLYHVHLRTMGPAGLIVSFFPLVFGAIRLARFNTQISGFEKHNFSGLPIPAAAGTFAAFIIFNFHIWDELLLTAATMPLVVVISLLMVTTIQFDAMPKFSFKSGKRNSTLFGLLIAGVLLLAFFPQTALFPMAVGYIGYSVARELFSKGRDGLSLNGVRERMQQNESNAMERPSDLHSHDKNE